MTRSALLQKLGSGLAVGFDCYLVDTQSAVKRGYLAVGTSAHVAHDQCTMQEAWSVRETISVWHPVHCRQLHERHAVAHVHCRWLGPDT
jgi:hypothetical protein